MALVAEDVQKSKRPAAAPTESLPVCVQLIPSDFATRTSPFLVFQEKNTRPLGECSCRDPSVGNSMGENYGQGGETS